MALGAVLKRVMVVVVDSVQLVNIYSSNYRHEREHLFGQMREWPWPQLEVVLFSDFNCVHSPHFDSLEGLRSGRPESPELETLRQALRLEDAQTLATSAMEDKALKPINYYTILMHDRPASVIVSVLVRHGQRSSSHFKYSANRLSIYWLVQDL